MYHAFLLLIGDLSAIDRIESLQNQKHIGLIVLCPLKTIGELQDMAGQFAIIKMEMWILFTKLLKKPKEILR